MILQGLGRGRGTEASGGRRKQIKESLAGTRNLPSLQRKGGAGNEGPLSANPYPNRPMPRGNPGVQGQKIGQGVPNERFKVAGVGGQRTGVGQNSQPGLGPQLSNRVKSGAIDQGQARKVAQQRRMLQKAFGSDWRTQVFGKGGAKGIAGPFSPAQVRAKRSAGLERAKRKLY
jgi:hypothetical protein